MKTNVILAASAVLILIASCPTVSAQDQNASLVKSLELRYPLTQPSGDNTQIVSTGALLLLLKNSVDMAPVTGTIKVPVTNTYKDGKLSSGMIGRLLTNKHTFVRGETMWVTNIAVKDDGVYFDVFSDPINDVRYKGIVKLPFPKGHPPTPEQAQSVAAEVFSVQAQEQTISSGTPPPSSSNPVQNISQPVVPAVAPGPPPIAPPPPPPDQPLASPPVTINETKQEVEAALGKPDRKMQANRKEIYFYGTRKITFVDGKVSRVD